MSGNERDQERQNIEELLDDIITIWNRYIHARAHRLSVNAKHTESPLPMTIKEIVDCKYEQMETGDIVDKFSCDEYRLERVLDKLLWRLHYFKLPLGVDMTHKGYMFIEREWFEVDTHYTFAMKKVYRYANTNDSYYHCLSND